MPEPLFQTLSGSVYSLDGDLTFGPAGPPSFTATAHGSYTSGAVSSMFGSVSGIVSFQVRVVETSTPPVAVTEVPVTVTANGVVTVVGSPLMFPYALATISITWGGGTFIDTLINATLIPTPTTGFNLNQTQSFAPGEILTGSMEAVASLGSEIVSPGISGTATAFIDPHFSVADETIPGTPLKYRDYYDIEYSSGFYALGLPTPTRDTTWGRIKSLY